MKVSIVSATDAPVTTISLAMGTSYNKNDSSFKRVKTAAKHNHGSVFEFANFVMRIDGISRACANQLVRHRLASFCLTGDTILRSFGQKSWTIKELYDWQFDVKRKGRLKLIKLRSVDEETNVIVPNSIQAITYSGQGEVFELVTESGRKLKCTANHKIYTPNGYKTLEELSVGDYVYSNGKELLKNPEWLYDYYVVQNHTRKETAEFIGCCESLVNRACREFGIVKPRSQYPNRKGGHGNKGMFSEEALKKLSEDKKGEKNPSYKKNREDLTISGGYQEANRVFDNDECEFCGSTKNVERHHKNKNPKDNRPENVMILCSKCHKLWHKQGAIGVFSDKIVSVTSCGIEDVYDVSMAAPYYNFVANSIVVHNCQQSQRYVKYKELGLTDFVYPDSIGGNSDAQNAFIEAIKTASEAYEKLLELGIKAEDARYVLPNAMTTSITVGMNAREFFNFLNLRLSKNAQWEIRELAEMMYNTLRAQNEEWDYLLSLYDEYMKNIIN